MRYELSCMCSLWPKVPVEWSRKSSIPFPHDIITWDVICKVLRVRVVRTKYEVAQGIKINWAQNLTLIKSKISYDLVNWEWKIPLHKHSPALLTQRLLTFVFWTGPASGTWNVHCESELCNIIRRLNFVSLSLQC